MQANEEFHVFFFFPLDSILYPGNYIHVGRLKTVNVVISLLLN